MAHDCFPEVFALLDKLAYGDEPIPMTEAVAHLRDLGLTQQEIGEAFARTGEDGEEPLAVAREIIGRRES